MGEEGTCPLCSETADICALDNGCRRVSCSYCGSFDTESSFPLEIPDAQRYLFSAWTRCQSGVVLSAHQIKRLCETLTPPTVDRKLQMLLRLITDRSEHAGRDINVSSTDRVNVWCVDDNELLFLIDTLVESGLLARSKYKTLDDFALVKVTAKGWRELQQKHAVIDEDQVFVAMWFDTSMHGAWSEGFKRGIEAVGFSAIRMDEVAHVERIDLRTLGEIRNSVALVADATGARPNVYYEAGFAEAMGRPVIWTIKESDTESAHFDTRQFRHIRWKDPKHFAKKLEDALSGILGRRKMNTEVRK